MQQMLRAKCHWGLHIGMLKPTLSIRAFGDPLVRARKAGRLMIMFLLLTNCSAKFDGFDTFKQQRIVSVSSCHKADDGGYIITGRRRLF